MGLNVAPTFAVGYGGGASDVGEGEFHVLLLTIGHGLGDGALTRSTRCLGAGFVPWHAARQATVSVLGASTQAPGAPWVPRGVEGRGGRLCCRCT